jgi:hypothetical protein
VFSQLDGRNVKFEGLAVPGTPNVPPEEALVAIWRTTKGERFQNYRALFTILDVPVVRRDWITRVEAGDPSDGPPAWKQFVRSGAPQPLLAQKTVAHRSPAQQRPKDSEGVSMIEAIHAWFEAEPTAFEACAAEIWRTIAPNTVSMDVTRPTRDGGRDAVGEYAIGPPSDRVHVEFALEAKCYRLDNSVGVKEVSRLISRLRHRQFGVLVTTSYVAEQAYREIRDDRPPVAIVSASDIVDALKSRGINSADATTAWLMAAYPKTTDTN